MTTTLLTSAQLTVYMANKGKKGCVEGVSCTVGCHSFSCCLINISMPSTGNITRLEKITVKFKFIVAFLKTQLIGICLGVHTAQ